MVVATPPTIALPKMFDVRQAANRIISRHVFLQQNILAVIMSHACDKCNLAVDTAIK